MFASSVLNQLTKLTIILIVYLLIVLLNYFCNQKNATIIVDLSTPNASPYTQHSFLWENLF